MGRRRRQSLRAPILASAAILLLALHGCITTDGMGKDMQSDGREVETAADANKWPQHRVPG